MPKKLKLAGKRFSTLLELLHEARNSDGHEDVFPQCVGSPDELDKGIPTLARNVYRDATPMLRARFDYAGRWKNADVGFDWFDGRQMRRCWRDKDIRERIEITRTYWEGSPPNQYPAERLTLFGFDPEDAGEIYLVWPRSGKSEPWVWRFSAQHCSEFETLRAYVVWLLSQQHGVCG